MSSTSVFVGHNAIHRGRVGELRSDTNQTSNTGSMGNQKLLVAPGITTSNKKLLETKGIPTKSKKLLVSPGITTLLLVTRSY